MANFKQHISVGFIGTGLLVAPLLAANIVNTSSATLLWICGSIGSIMPDIDSDNAVALDLVFLALSLFVIDTVLETFGFNRSGLEIILLVLGAFLATSLLRLIFEKQSRHRGVFHSLLAAVFFGLTTCVIAWYVHQTTAAVAWLCGVFMVFGTVMHLVLDEIYAVDFMNAHIKRSFGSALKLTHLKSWKASLALLAACGALWHFTPSPRGFLAIFTDTSTYERIWNALLPAQWL